MLKICKRCEKEVFNDEKICPFCGQSDFIVIDLEDKSNSTRQTVNQSRQTVNDYYKNQEKQTTQSTNDNYAEQSTSHIKNTYKKSEGSKKATIIIVVLVLIVNIIALIGSLISEQDSEDTKNSLNSGKENYSESSEGSSGSSEVMIPYSKGKFDGTIYINEWADIMFTMPEGFSESEQES